MKMVSFADDLVITVAATALPLAQERMSILDRIIEWAETRGHQFPSQKTQVMTLKGGLKPRYQIRFNNDIFTSTSPVKYPGVSIDYKRNYWSHIEQVAGKSEAMYSRIRAATTCNWGIKQSTSKVIYKAVFIP